MRGRGGRRRAAPSSSFVVDRDRTDRHVSAMRSALIGHTGFVGSNLLRQRSFDRCYRSSNIDEIRGESFDLLVCAGVRAEKWIANANPEQDRAGIERLTDALGSVAASRVVLISTVDVFREPVGPDERTPVETEGLHAYGRHRYGLEQWVGERFDTTVIRLPGLYGPGIKKNVIHDFLRDHETDRIDSRGVFQFYGLGRLWRDIETALANDLELVHLVTEPVSVAEVARSAFGMEFENHVVERPARYDLRTIRAPVFGGAAPYLESREEVLGGIRAFVVQERGRSAES
jgi:nucleoside-diphosphate-sugar epimerase